MNLSNVIGKKPGVCGGKPIIKGHRIPVWQVAELFQKGATASEIAEGYEAVSKDQIEAALQYFRFHKEEIQEQIEANKVENLLKHEVPNVVALNEYPK